MRTLPLTLAVIAGFGFSNAGHSQIPDSSVRRQTGVVGRGGGQAARGARQLEKQEQKQEQKQQQKQQQGVGPANRPALERQVRQALARVVRQRLSLNDQQMQSLSRVDDKYDVQRRTLLRDERGARQGLKAAMAASPATGDSAARQARIAQYIDQLTQAKRRTADLVTGEQQELSSFLTPLQRAQYLVLKENVTARVLQFQQSTGGGRGAGRRGVPPLEP